MIRTLARAFACSLMLFSAAFAADTYPRTGAVLISGQNYWDTTYQADIAKMQVVVLNTYPGWGAGHGTTMEKTIQQLKARNSKLKVFLYVQAAQQTSPVPLAWQGLSAKLDAQRWWLYQPWGSGTKVASDCGSGSLLNISPYSNKDSSGLHYNQWIARYLVSQVGTTTPSADGFFTDCVFWQPRTNGDWNQDGKTDTGSNSAVSSWFRQGYVQYLDSLHAAWPGKMQIANVADWGTPTAVVTEYQGEFNGGVIEGLIGRPYSAERLTGGWQMMMAQYRKTMATLAAPKYAMFMMSGSITDYQGMRYGLASASMDDGYFAFKDQTKSYSSAVHFDEYDAKLGSATTGPQKSAWQSGVYRRDFQYGIILVNPKGNGVRTVTLERNFQKLKGTQAPSVNNGQVVRTVTLQDRDGIVLMRTP
jgi:hypothetical protein